MPCKSINANGMKIVWLITHEVTVISRDNILMNVDQG